MNNTTVYAAPWAMEAAMDVEWAHAIAPGANIDLIEARTSSSADLLAAVNLARNAPGVSVVSMSWSFNEADFLKGTGLTTEQQADAYFTTPANHTPVTFIGASGDGSASAGAQYPASSPNVLAVGGTNLKMVNGQYSSETAWSTVSWTTTSNGQTVQHSQGSGGGISKYEAQPSYMASFNSSTMRTTPDVSFDADTATPVYTYHSEDGGWETGAGTSFGTQAWAGIIALANQGRTNAHKADLKNTDKDIYSLSSSDFRDITSGNNGYSATVGYDLATGRGTPKATVVVEDLIAVNEPNIPTVPVNTQPISTLGTTKAAAISASVSTISPADPVFNAPLPTVTTIVQVSTPVIVAGAPVKPTGQLNSALTLADLLERTDSDADADRLIDSLFAEDVSYLVANSANHGLRNSH